MNNPIAGEPVQFAVTAGGGTVATPTVVTAVNGRASTAWTLGAAGAQQVTATAKGHCVRRHLPRDIRLRHSRMTMPELQTLDCFQPALGKLERVKYFNRMLLTAEDMRTDQDFVLQKLRRHNRFLHGWGVVCGLVVKAAPTTALPWRVQIGEGLCARAVWRRDLRWPRRCSWTWRTAVPARRPTRVSRA